MEVGGIFEAVISIRWDHECEVLMIQLVADRDPDAPTTLLFKNALTRWWYNVLGFCRLCMYGHGKKQTLN